MNKLEIHDIIHLKGWNYYEGDFRLYKYRGGYQEEKKVLHKMMDIIMLVFFASLGNADDWVEMEVFGRAHEKFLRKYLELPNGIPSHDTIQRVCDGTIGIPGKLPEEME